MRLLRKHRVELIRPKTDGKYNEDGEWVSGSTPYTTTLPCCIQPDFELMKKVDLPEGVRLRDCRVMWTHDDVLIANEISYKVSDNIRYKNTLYEVHEVAPWDGVSLKATRAILVKKDYLSEE